MYSKDFKQKYFLLCLEKKLESGNLIKKYSDLVVREKKKQYICITEIK